MVAPATAVVGVVPHTVSAALPPRAFSARNEYRAEWKDKVRHLGALAREGWLRSSKGIIAFGAKASHQMAKDEVRRHEVVQRAACSATWSEAFDEANLMLPGLEFGKRLRLHARADGRRYSVRLMLSAEETRSGDGPGSRRWTPPQAVDLEDHIDGMSVDEATYKCLGWPGSCSAIAIQRIEAAKATPIDGNW